MGYGMQPMMQQMGQAVQQMPMMQPVMQQQQPMGYGQ